MGVEALTISSFLHDVSLCKWPKDKSVGEELLVPQVGFYERKYNVHCLTVTTIKHVCPYYFNVLFRTNSTANRKT